MKNEASRIAVAGHICLDIIPTFSAAGKEATAEIKPGQLYLMGPALRATGGAVSNTGLALHQLGTPVTLMGKIADDLFGGEVLNILQSYHPDLAEGMIVTAGENTSYSIVISPPGVDRSFLHCPGANDTFGAEDVVLGQLENCDFFHFGYPPLMQRFYADGGEEMSCLFRKVQEQGLFTSLDMAMPDVQSAAGQIDWPKWLTKVLPSVDLFLPSIEEILLMLGHSSEPMQNTGYDVAMLGQLADQLLAMGTKIVVLKLGEQGLYLRTSPQAITPSDDRPASRQLPATWNDREMLAPCFEVKVAGTTGAGDSSIAGFLAALAAGAAPEAALVQAAAVGACSVEVADATSGICNTSQLRQRIDSGWKRDAIAQPGTGWHWNEAEGIWHGQAEGCA